MSRSKTGRSKDHILQSFGVVELIECVDLSVEHQNLRELMSINPSSVEKSTEF